MQLNDFGVYTLANDAVYDQLIALLNSIECNVDPDVLVCVIPFDKRIEKIRREIDSRKNAWLFEDQALIQRWENFAEEVWSYHPKANKRGVRYSPYGKGHHRKFVVFDGPFQQFVFYDADSLAMKPLNSVVEQLKEYDFVFDDWEHKKSIQNAALDILLIEKTRIYTEEVIRPKLHCSSFFGAKRGIFDEKELGELTKKLTEENEISWVPRFWDDAFLFNYMTLRSERPLFNFTLSSNGSDRTGNCADSDPFVNIDNVLYNEQGLKPIHRLHYMNYSSKLFEKLSKGIDVNVKYKYEFLYYRFLKDLEKRPMQLRTDYIQKIREVLIR